MKILDTNAINVYCVIVTYNAMKWIETCLSSLYHSSIIPHIIVIDNCSSDNTLKFISEKYPDVIIIKNNINKGFGQANNQGIELAYQKGATNIFLLNQDAYVDPSTIETLVSIQNENNISVLSPIHMNGDYSLLDTSFFRATIVYMNNIEFVSDLVMNKKQTFYKAKIINAAAWMVSRKTIEEIGGFDPIFFHYGEDVQYCQRLLFHNKVLAFTPFALVRHDRILHGNLKVFNKNENLNMLLVYYGNINGTSWKTKLLIHLRIILSLCTTLFHFKFVDFIYIFRKYISFFMNYGKVRKSKRTNSRIGMHWLKDIEDVKDV